MSRFTMARLLRSGVIHTAIIAFSCLLLGIIITIGIWGPPAGRWLAVACVVGIGGSLIYISLRSAHNSTIEAKDKAFAELINSLPPGNQREAQIKMRKEYEEMYGRKENSAKATWIEIIAVILCGAWVWISVWLAFRYSSELATMLHETHGNSVEAISLGVVWARLIAFLAMLGTSVFAPIGVFRCLQKHYSDYD